MRFIFKTSYEQDIRLAKHGGHVFWYSLLCLALVAAPWVAPEYWLAQLTFVLIYAIVGLGLMLLAGFTGLFSLGHAAFLGVGAYTQAVLTGMGWPFALSLACAAGLSAAVRAVGVGHRRQLRQAPGAATNRGLLVRDHRVVLLSVPCDCGGQHPRHPEPAALAHGPCVCRHP